MCVTWLIHMCDWFIWDVTHSYVRHDSFIRVAISNSTSGNSRLLGTAYCVWSVISSVSNLNRWSSSLGLFCHVLLKRDQRDGDWKLRVNDAPNTIGGTSVIWDMTHSYVGHVPFMCGTWLIHMCDWFVCVVSLIHMCDRFKAQLLFDLVTQINEWCSSFRYLFHIYMGHDVSLMNESCPMWMSHVTREFVIPYMKESCHRGINHVNMNESCQIRMSHVTYEWDMSHMNQSSHTWMSHVTHVNLSCHTYEWVMSPKITTFSSCFQELCHDSFICDITSCNMTHMWNGLFVLIAGRCRWN